MLEDIRAYAQEAIEHLGRLAVADLPNDRLRLLALSRAAEIVGEAAFQVPAVIRAQLPAIEFDAAISMRHRLIHGYGSLSVAILVETIDEEGQ
ncbi:MAG TPA: HepT-like ribonuclease domain-containing protein [Caulobacteraceae bacterium]|nr:HepT-like ribonuclease domain-containing protein [Caulobacteraceae bacterium]